MMTDHHTPDDVAATEAVARMRAAIELVVADTREVDGEPDMTVEEAIAEVRGSLSYDDISVVDDPAVYAAYRLVLDATETDMRDAGITGRPAPSSADPWRPPAADPADGREPITEATPEADDPSFSGHLLGTEKTTSARQRCDAALRAADEAVDRIDQVVADEEVAEQADRDAQITRWSTDDRVQAVEQETGLYRELF